MAESRDTATPRRHPRGRRLPTIRVPRASPDRGSVADREGLSDGRHARIYGWVVIAGARLRPSSRVRATSAHDCTTYRRTARPLPHRRTGGAQRHGLHLQSHRHAHRTPGGHQDPASGNGSRSRPFRPLQARGGGGPGPGPPRRYESPLRRLPQFPLHGDGVGERPAAPPHPPGTEAAAAGAGPAHRHRRLRCPGLHPSQRRRAPRPEAGEHHGRRPGTTSS